MKYNNGVVKAPIRETYLNNRQNANMLNQPYLSSTVPFANGNNSGNKEEITRGYDLYAELFAGNQGFMNDVQNTVPVNSTTEHSYNSAEYYGPGTPSGSNSNSNSYTTAEFPTEADANLNAYYNGGSSYYALDGNTRAGIEGAAALVTLLMGGASIAAGTRGTTAALSTGNLTRAGLSATATGAGGIGLGSDLYNSYLDAQENLTGDNQDANRPPSYLGYLSLFGSTATAVNAGLRGGNAITNTVRGIDTSEITDAGRFDLGAFTRALAKEEGRKKAEDIFTNPIDSVDTYRDFTRRRETIPGTSAIPAR